MKATLKRVLLLVCLIVSLVQLDWERDRLYLLSSIASMLLILYGELTRRRKVQTVAAERAFIPEGISRETYASESPHPGYPANQIEKGSSSATVEEVALIHHNSG